METLIASVAGAVAGCFAWLNARKAKNQTNGNLHEKLDRMESKLDDLAEWQGDHIHRWHRN